MIANKQEDVGIFEVTKGNRQRLRFIEAPFDGFGDLGFDLRIT